MDVISGKLYLKPVCLTNSCVVQSQMRNYQFISCHTLPESQLCGLLSYGRPRLRKRLFGKATWTFSNSHKILFHLRMWRLNSNRSSFQRRRLMTSFASLMFACWGWPWGPAMSGDAAQAEWDGCLCLQFTVWKSFCKTPQPCRNDFIFLFCRLWEDIGMRWRLSWERWVSLLGCRTITVHWVKANFITLLIIVLLGFDDWFEYFHKMDLNWLKTLYWACLIWADTMFTVECAAVNNR